MPALGGNQDWVNKQWLDVFPVEEKVRSWLAVQGMISSPVSCMLLLIDFHADVKSGPSGSCLLGADKLLTRCH